MRLLLAMPLALLLPRIAAADCPSTDIWLGRAEEAIVSARLSEAENALQQAEAGFSCGAASTTAQIGRFWRAEGVLLTLQKKPLDAAHSFAAAQRVAPGVWTAAFGGELEKVALAATPEPGAPLPVRLDPWPVGELGFVDGQRMPLPAQVSPGLHLVQAGPAPSDIEFGQIFLASGADSVVISTPFTADAGLLPVAKTMAAPQTHSSRGASIALIAGGGAAAATGGALLWLASLQNEHYAEAV